MHFRLPGLSLHFIELKYKIGLEILQQCLVVVG